jgi:hypothetical protein
MPLAISLVAGHHPISENATQPIDPRYGRPGTQRRLPKHERLEAASAAGLSLGVNGFSQTNPGPKNPDSIQGRGMQRLDEAQDPGLKMIDARELFGQHKIYVGFRRKVHLSETLLYFVQLYAPKVLRQTIEAAVNQ